MTTDDPATVQRAIDAGNAQWRTAFKTQDANLLANIFIPDGALLRLNGDVVRGRDAIRERMGGAMQRLGPADVGITTLNVWIIDDAAHEYGAYTYAWQGDDGQLLHDAGHYLVVWQKQTDGTYRIATDLGLPNEP
jgi:uncharacterized protein (TIGR02246 family)